MKPIEFEKHIIDLEKRLLHLKDSARERNEDVELYQEYQHLKEKIAQSIEVLYNNLTPWEIVQVARNFERPQFLDYLNNIFTQFIEIRGDRNGKDDRSIISGMAYLENEKVFIIGQQRGKTLKDIAEIHNRGMTMPEGYRKALRIMKLAEKFNKPIITFIDTPGAYPGLEAENHNQGEAIAYNLQEMAGLKTPIISIVIGEGGSGGALGIGVSDIILMLKYSIYSVISPEGAAMILFKDSTKAQEAAHALKITSQELLKLNIIDEIVNEPLGGAHRFPVETMNEVKKTLLYHLKNLKKIPPYKLPEKRLQKYLQIGFYETN